ncbi:hypothetical protein SEA_SCOOBYDOOBYDOO_229 [Mycobacterium phage ScoobyDoobyDoo]|nr:hypothetical protein SEA_SCOOBYDOOBYDOO_229 [Mycobacterium phage ScoobyDoobyDoo]
MSKYSDRHRIAPPCAIPNCPSPGAKLVRVEGRPAWLCSAHAEPNPTP